MFRVIFICILLSMSMVGYGQQEARFGEVSLSDFQEKYGDDYPAAVLYDRGYSKFYNNNGINIQYTQETRIHIHQKSGFDYAEVSIPYYLDGFGKTEMIKEIEAYSYTIDPDKGLIDKRPLDTKEIYEEEINANWKIKKFVFPNVREGSIVEYRYVKKTPFLFNPPDWEFQREIPTKQSTYEIYLTPFYEYSYLLQGANKFDNHETWESKKGDSFSGINYKYMVHRYTMNDIPPFTDESFITAKRDYLMKLDFQLARINYPSGATRDIMTTWADICNDYLERDNFGKYLKQIRKYTEDIIENESSLQVKENQIKTIVNYVRDNYVWDGLVRDFTEHKAKEFIQVKEGSSGEINLFLCGLLRDAGYTAYPVILSTRKNGKIPTRYPFKHYFNDVVVAVKQNDRFQLLDGTESALSYDRLPIRSLNEVGLLVYENSEEWVSLESNNQSVENNYLHMKLDLASMSADVRVANRYSGYAGYIARKTVGSDEEKLESSSFSGGMDNLDEISFKNVDFPDKPYILNFVGQRSIENFGDKLMVNPFQGYIESESPFKATSRKYPVDMIFPKTTQITALVEIPEGYGLLEIPEEFTMDNPMIHSYLKVEQREGLIQLSARITFRSGVYEAKDYKKLKSQYAFVLRKLNEMVVLSPLPSQ